MKRNPRRILTLKVSCLRRGKPAESLELSARIPEAEALEYYNRLFGDVRKLWETLPIHNQPNPTPKP